MIYVFPESNILTKIIIELFKLNEKTYEFIILQCIKISLNNNGPPYHTLTRQKCIRLGKALIFEP